MPKRRAARGRRGGGNVGRKITKAAADESDVTEARTDVDSSHETSVGLVESDIADDSVNEDTGTEDAVDEVPILKDNVIQCVLQEKTVEEKNEGGSNLSETNSKGNEEAAAIDELAGTDLNSHNAKDSSQYKAQEDILKEDPNTECALVCDLENNKVVERENDGDELSMKCPGEREEIIAQKCQQPKASELIDQPVKESEINNVKDGLVKGNVKEECQASEEHEEIIAEKCQQPKASELIDQPGKESELNKVKVGLVKGTADEECPALEKHGEESSGAFDENKRVGMDVCFVDKEVEGDENEGVSMDVCLVDKEVEGDQKEVEEVQYIDEEACEDQQSTDDLKIISSHVVTTPEKSKLQKENEIGKNIDNPIELDDDDTSTSLMTSELQKDEEIDNSKFEEISEGSIDQDQEELIVEPISDVEITGESFEPKKTSKNGDVKEDSSKVHYKEPESLEEVFFATENDDLKTTAEDKDNDDVSDTSLSNHADANLSLEEISDDDLEPSKKRKKSSGVTPVKTDNLEEKTTTSTPDVECKSVEKSEVKPNKKNVPLQKRSASDDSENPEGNSNKRLKMTNETKDSEETPSRSENDVAGDAKKDGKKPQAKESDAFHGRSVAKESDAFHGRSVAKESDVFHGRSASHNRNLSQSSKNGQQESRERAFSSRDSAEYKRRYELVSTMSQTEPRQLKGKIVQCNINPVRSVPEPLERISEKYAVESRLVTKFRKKIPSSIPEKIFSAVTSLYPPQLENAYSFSMGPVTLSDIDCPKFRLSMRDMEEFSLVFDKHTQGIQTATLASHESLTSLIRHLKNLELGNRYMVMSVVYKYGVERTVGIWKATLLFMYEQDIQMESLNLVNDGKVRAKLCLKGVPRDVSKDFIRLLFPEAINVCAGPRQLKERTVVLGFSNDKIVEEIISCYDLLIICGCQISISRVDLQETQQDLLSDGSEESKAILIEDIQDGGDALEKSCVNENVEKKAESCEQQEDLQPQSEKIVVQDSNQVEGTKKDQITLNDREAATQSEDSVKMKTQEQEKNDMSTKENIPANNIDASAGVTLTATEVSLTEVTSTSDSMAEGDKILVENATDDSTKMQTDEVPMALDIEKGEQDIGKGEQEETTKASLVNAENSSCLAEGGADKPADSLLGDAMLLETTDEEASKLGLGSQNNTDPAVPLLKVVESVDKIDVDNVSNSLVDDTKIPGKTSSKDSGKQESDRLDSGCPEVELLKSAELPSDTSVGVILTDAVADSSERKIGDKNVETLDGSTMEIEVNAVGKKTSEEKIDKNFEDISDEETVNQSKQSEPEDVIILKQDSPQSAAVEIDLTVESDASGKVVTEDVKQLAGEKVLQPSSQTEKLQGSRIKKTSDVSEEKNVDPKLVMTDGDLEISMEVIDVTEGDQQVEKVIYARTYQKPRSRSKERRSWDARSYKTAPYVPQPRRENHWSDVSRSDTYYGSHEPYKQYPPKENTYRMQYYPPQPTPDETAYYRAPAREATSYRREPYHSKQKRRTLTLDKHSSSHASDRRTSDHWDRRYGSWQPSTYEDSKRSESYSRPPAESSGRQAYWQSHSTSHHSPPRSHKVQQSSPRPRDHHSRGDSRGPYDSDRRRKYKKSRSRSLSDMSISSSELIAPVRKSSHRRESPKRPAAHTSRSPISVSSRSRSLSPVSKSPSMEYTQPGTGKDKLVKTVKHFLELAKGIKQAHRRQSNRSQSPKSPPLRRSKSPLRSRRRSSSVSSSLLRKALDSPRRTDSRRPRSRSPHQSWSRNSRSPTYSKSQRRRHERSSSASSHGGDYKRRYKEHYMEKRAGSHHRQSPDHHYDSRRPQNPESSHPVNEPSSRSKSGQWSDSKYKNSSSQSWQQPFGGYPVSQSSGSVSTSTVYNPTYPPPGCPPQQQTSLYSSSSVPVYQYSNPSQFYSNIPPPYLHVPPPAPIAQPYQPPSYTVYQPTQPYSSLQAGTSSGLNMNANNASSKTKSWSMGNSAMVFQRVLGSDKKGGKANKSGVISKIEDRERLERPKVTKTERVLTTVQMQKK